MGWQIYIWKIYSKLILRGFLRLALIDLSSNASNDPAKPVCPTEVQDIILSPPGLTTCRKTHFCDLSTQINLAMLSISISCFMLLKK